MNLRPHLVSLRCRFVRWSAVALAVTGAAVITNAASAGTGAKPEPNPPLGTLNSWERADMMQVARAEIGNAVRLRQLILESEEPLFEMAETPAGEWIQMLSPALADQLKRKIDLMNARWRDYDRLFTAPNP